MLVAHGAERLPGKAPNHAPNGGAGNHQTRMSSDGDLTSCLDAAQLRPRYWGAFALIVLLLVCELFDFFVVGYLVSAIAPLWGLNFGQTTLMLLGAGIGALVGAIVFGWLADRIGRKAVVVLSAFLCCVCAGSTAF